MSNLYTETISHNIFLVGEINGYKCKNIGALCAELRDTFRWPSYEICMEAMYHLDWCEESNFKIIVKKFNSIKDRNQKDLIKNELKSYKEYWDQRRLNNKTPNKNIFIIEYT